MSGSASKILKCEKKAISNPIQSGSWTFDVKHQSGVQFCLAFRSNGQYTNSNIFIEKLVSTAYKLKKIDLTVTSKGGVGPKIVELSKTDFRFDVEKEKLGSIPWQQQPFQVVCVAEVERAGPNGTLLSDLTEEFLLDPDNPAFADITLECEGVELKSHSFVLAARSPVFKRMLSQGDFLEQQTGRIKIKEMDVGILRQMIRFVYTDSVEIDEASVPALYYAADRYDIKNLIKFCLDRMLLHVDATSAAECYRLAHLRGHRELRKKSAKVIQENFEEVRATSGWILLKADSHLLEDFLAESFSAAANAAAKAAAPQSPTQPDPYYDDDDDDDDDDYYY